MTKYKKSIKLNRKHYYDSLNTACCYGLACRILTNENFNQLNLIGANFTWSNLRYSSFRGCNLKYSDLSGADLEGADFTGADLYGASLEGSKIEKCKGKKVVKIAGPQHNIYYIDGNVHIGCKCATVEWWLKNGKRLGLANSYLEEEEIEWYLNQIKQLV